jgi:AraC-like DNA-binding protein
VNTRLKYIKDWQELAIKVDWSASRLAQECGVSLRTLERHFRDQLHVSPKTWLVEERDKKAIELLKNGFSIKEAAANTGYQNTSTFCREFKRRQGQSPTTSLAKHCPPFSRVA